MSGDSGRPELDADPGADATAGLGHGVFPGPLAAAAHHDQIPVAERKSQPGPATARAKLQYPGGADGQDRDHGVRVRTSTDPVSVPRHAVGSVAVQTQSRGDELLAEFGRIVGVQLVPCLPEHRMGQLGVGGVPAEQSGHVDLAVVHGASLGPPRDVAQQYVADMIRPGQPAGQVIDPRARWLLPAPAVISVRCTRPANGANTGCSAASTVEGWCVTGMAATYQLGPNRCSGTR